MYIYMYIIIIMYALLVVEYHKSVCGQWAYKAAYLLTARVIPHKCGACGATLDLSMPAYWPTRVCGGK